jgi:hypothetical protein
LLDITDEFVVLTGSGVAVPPGSSGLALGDPDCAA